MDSDGDGLGDACDACPEVFGEDFEIFDQGFSTLAQIGIPTFYNRNYGDKRYKLTNHLGNVVSVITDRGIVREPSNGFVLNPNFLPNVLNMHDYYPFGMLMPIRNLSAEEYSYGFQGQEKDDELKGEGNSLNYTFRMHDPRVGRFFAVDPLAAKFPHLTPYQFASNSPIALRELEGLEGKMYTLDLNVEKPMLKFDYEKDLDYWTNFLEPDYITVTVKGPENSEIKYTFTRFGSTGAMHNGEFGEAPHIDDFPKFQKDPLGALASGKYVPERTVKVHILRDAVIALVLRRVMKTGNGRGRSNIDPEEQSLYKLVDSKAATGNGGRKFWFMHSIFKGKKFIKEMI